MKNQNYNLVKLLLSKLDTVWRIEKHYLNDVEDDSCKEVLNKILEDDKRHIELLKAEISSHIKEGKFD
jgi:hypothetical protein